MKYNKILAYITRQTTRGTELLVFNHHDFPDAGTQVIAGTVATGEKLEIALAREIREESGLTEVKIEGLLLTTDHFHTEKQQHHRRHYFRATAPDDTPDAWSHTVSAGEEDSGMVFDFFWLPLALAQKQLTDKQGQAISAISADSVYYIHD